MLHKTSLFTLNYIETDIFSCFQCNNEDEIVSVIAHELGHWKLNHTVYSFVAVQVFLNTFCRFSLYAETYLWP
jgi:Zn-dependent protease with chaperone function